ncbi:MAG: histidine kinase [Chloroflexi bacterium]|nr:MAG: histidine kinase [Chloroflexota bacterium]
MIKAKAAITDGFGNVTIDTIEVYPPEQDEVLVEIKAAGVCHTDYIYMSREIPRILGHEGAGIVQQVGPGVMHVQPGDRVLLNWATNCGTCFQCQRGNYSLCENRCRVPNERSLYKGEGIERAFYLGTMSTHTVVAKQAVNKIEVDVSFPSAAIVGCGVMTGYGSVVNTAKVEPGSNVVVIGAGGVGLNIVQGARIAGAGKIIAVDINQSKLEMAVQFGATHILLADRDDEGLLNAAEKIKAMTGGRGADYAFEATAVTSLGAAPLAMIRNGGVAVQASGIEEDLTINMRLFEWDKVYINPRYGMCRPEIDFPRLFRLYEKGDLLLDELVTRTYKLEELPQAFADMHTGINAKGVLVME